MSAGDPSFCVWDDEFCTVEQAGFCAVPGYLILRVKLPASSWADLPQDAARAVGERLARVTSAIETVTRAERVYCLSFGELDRRLHFHLFPRTAAILADYWRATGTENVPVNGPAVFEWARATRVPGTGEPSGASEVADVCESLRAYLSAFRPV